MQDSAITLYDFTHPMCYPSPIGLDRCLTAQTDYFPPGYYSKVSNGYGIIVQNTIVSARRLASDLIANQNSLESATASKNDFWYLYDF